MAHILFFEEIVRISTTAIETRYLVHTSVCRLRTRCVVSGTCYLYDILLIGMEHTQTLSVLADEPKGIKH